MSFLEHVKHVLLFPPGGTKVLNDRLRAEEKRKKLKEINNKDRGGGLSWF